MLESSQPDANHVADMSHANAAAGLPPRSLAIQRRRAHWEGASDVTEKYRRLQFFGVTVRAYR
jgi:hypothetical protein